MREFYYKKSLSIEHSKRGWLGELVVYFSYVSRETVLVYLTIFYFHFLICKLDQQESLDQKNRWICPNTRYRSVQHQEHLGQVRTELSKESLNQGRLV